jgi:hypothetical protein
MGLKETLDNARIGQSAQNAKAIESGSKAVADQYLAREEARMAREQALVEARARRDEEIAKKSFLMGQSKVREDVMQRGVVPVETAEAAVTGAEVQGQQQGYQAGSEEQAVADTEQAVEQNVMDQAQNIVSQIDEAQAQGATPDQIKQMVQSIPPELQGPIQQIQQDRAQAMANQSNEAQVSPTQIPGQQQPGMSAQKNPSIANQMSDKVMQDIAQMEMQKQQALEQEAMQQAQAAQQPQ